MEKERKNEEVGEEACQTFDHIICPFCGGVMPLIESRTPYYICGHCEYDIAVGYADEYKEKTKSKPEKKETTDQNDAISSCVIIGLVVGLLVWASKK